MHNISNAKIAEILQLGGYKPTREDLELIFKNIEEDEEKEDVSDLIMAHFMDGIVYFKRGKSDQHPPRPIELPVTNNDVLKKMRVAFKLRESDIGVIIKNAGFSVTSVELSALFRDKSHRNFRPCGDQLLRYFLRGLTMRLRVDD